MANINITPLSLKTKLRRNGDAYSLTESDKLSKNIAIYSDLKLDLSFGNVTNKEMNSQMNTKDLNLIQNDQCIITSIRNIFNTSYNTRLLNPDMDMNLSKYLFTTITRNNAWFIGYDIMNNLPRYEPRIKINSISVIPDEERSQYNMTLEISIPIMDRQTTLTGTLNQMEFLINE